jgi:hypothetical protein
MKLFPASASPAALTSVANHAYDNWRTGAREQIAMDDDERRHVRCIELAAEAFEDCDLSVHEWLARDDNREDVLTLAIACIRQDDDLRRTTLQELTERYVEQCADKYLDAVLDEERRHEEDAMDEQWWERTHG